MVEALDAAAQKQHLANIQARVLQAISEQQSKECRGEQEKMVSHNKPSFRSECFLVGNSCCQIFECTSVVARHGFSSLTNADFESSQRTALFPINNSDYY